MTITETTQLIVGAFVVFTMGIIVGSAGGPPASPERRRPACNYLRMKHRRGAGTLALTCQRHGDACAPAKGHLL